ncbi:MAG: iron-containing alcohol dehydrogenase, partial [Bacilli bacterium]|nr:iron-containing alcohol dehydrogenase [Bacilli bacterium]
NPIIVASPSLVRHNLLVPLTDELDKLEISYFIYARIKPNPTFEVVEEIKEAIIKNNNDSIIAVGGGSSIDAAKAAAASISTGKPLNKLRGLLKVNNKYPMFIAVPTTAGSASEVSLASVVTNEKTGDKFAIGDPRLIPDVAVHDPVLMETLPPCVIATTGMDALTHAVEAYVGRATTKSSRIQALTSIVLIKENLLKFYNNPKDNAAATEMLHASYLAGQAFSRSYVGYVHAMAHSLGGKYNISHGEANAILLPYVLKAYGKKAKKKLDVLSNLGDNPADFVQFVESLNEKMNIKNNLKDIVKLEDLDELAKHAAKEANPLYPVPREMSWKEIKELYLEIINDGNNN